MIQIWLHNNSGATKSYSGTGDIIDGAFYQLESSSQREELTSDSDLMADVASGDISVSVDGLADLEVDAAEQWNFLLRGQYLSTDSDNKLNTVSNKGNGDFETYLTHDFTDTSSWPAVDDSVFVLEPPASTIYRLDKAEVQFTHDIAMSGVTELYFDVWAYNPLVDLGSAIDADDPTFVPGVSSGNPLRFLVERQTYKSIKDVLNKGNEHFTIPYALDGMSHGMTTVQFNYPKWIELKSSQGAQVRVSTKDDDKMNGEFCTISFLVSKIDE